MVTDCVFNIGINRRQAYSVVNRLYIMIWLFTFIMAIGKENGLYWLLILIGYLFDSQVN